VLLVFRQRADASLYPGIQEIRRDPAVEVEILSAAPVSASTSALVKAPFSALAKAFTTPLTSGRAALPPTDTLPEWQVSKKNSALPCTCDSVFANSLFGTAVARKLPGSLSCARK